MKETNNKLHLHHSSPTLHNVGPCYEYKGSLGRLCAGRLDHTLPTLPTRAHHPRQNFQISQVDVLRPFQTQHVKNQRLSQSPSPLDRHFCFSGGHDLNRRQELFSLCVIIFGNSHAGSLVSWPPLRSGRGRQHSIQLQEHAGVACACLRVCRKCPKTPSHAVFLDRRPRRLPGCRPQPRSNSQDPTLRQLGGSIQRNLRPYQSGRRGEGRRKAREDHFLDRLPARCRFPEPERRQLR